MPSRMIDGDAMWTSSKLKKVQPTLFRLHYANWLPMAEANGVFEVDFDIIRAKIYPVIDPNFTAENVRQVFVEFVRVGLLTWFADNGKDYAYFVGINKPGRLPSGKHLKRYKNLPPIPEPSRIDPANCGTIPEGFGFGLDWSGTDRRGKGLVVASSVRSFEDYADKVSS